jgi:hypothetical protein
VRRIEWTYSALPMEAIMLAIAVPITVPATPNSEHTIAAVTAAAELAMTWVLEISNRSTGSSGSSGSSAGTERR